MSRKNSWQRDSELRNLNWDLYEYISDDYPEKLISELLDMGANPDYIIPGKGESSRTLAKRLNAEEKLKPQIAKLLKI